MICCDGNGILFVRSCGRYCVYAFCSSSSAFRTSSECCFTSTFGKICVIFPSLLIMKVTLFGKESSDSKHAIGFGNFLALVTKDGEWQIVFLREFGM